MVPGTGDHGPGSAPRNRIQLRLAHVNKSQQRAEFGSRATVGLGSLRQRAEEAALSREVRYSASWTCPAT